MQQSTASSTDHLVALVVTYNRLEQLQVTLARLLAARSEGLDRIIVIDNASTDGTRDWLATQTDPALFVHRCAVNGGGAGGFEAGMRLAVERFDPDWILVMDDDARPEPGALTGFHAKERNSAMAWSAAVYHPDGRICDMNRPTLNPFWHRGMVLRTLLGMLQGKSRDGFHLGAADYAATETRAVDSGSFVGLFISRRAIQTVGYPDGALFIYGDDALYSLAMRQAGGEILFDPAIRFEHDFTTITDADQRFVPLWKSYYYYRNLMMVYRLAAGPWFWLVLPLMTLKWTLRARAHRGERMRYLTLMIRALRDGVMQRTGTTHTQVLEWSRK
ncbi:GT2 family glycosyltransferase [Sulfitobacter undariae]|uniref:GT2 family glycosyltransferase n=1 Tax=Sulfitobacter undariae TaxID=1563671 RepID=A0A7W6E717_9RHOB|nr:glycosyltransferase [Sulfitobacter undariae]MBB3995903.1 GT2 family glycosyltransferase [Sulfitobacter undariae]